MKLYPIAWLSLLPLSSATLGLNTANIPSRFLRHHDKIGALQVDDVVPRNVPYLATDEVWNKTICKGSTLMRQMEGTSAEAGALMTPPLETSESNFQSEYYPDSYGWRISDFNDFSMMEDGLGIMDAFYDLKLTIIKEKNPGKRWVHAVDTTFGPGQKYPATNGTFVSLVNPNGGAVVSIVRNSPYFMARAANPPIPDNAVTPMSRFSDMIFQQFRSLVDEKNQKFNLRYLMFTPVENEVALAIIARALSQAGKRLSSWPGVTFPMKDAQGEGLRSGLAILGTSYGTGASFTLFTHKGLLGNKVVEKVTVFQDARNTTADRPPSLVFHIKDM